MDKLEKIAYNCRKATMLIEKQQLERLTVSERVELKIHLAGCSVCRLFKQQSTTINQMVKHLLNERAARSVLHDDFKKSLQDKINARLGK